MIYLKLNVEANDKHCNKCIFLKDKYPDYEECLLFQVKLNKDESNNIFRCCECHSVEFNNED